MTTAEAGSNSLPLPTQRRHERRRPKNVARNENQNQQASDSQRAQILMHMQKGHRLTAIGALRLFGCARLAARIDDLRGDGWPVISESIKVVNRDGKTVRVAEYYLDGSAQ